jgi:O-antigen/teichoic acid export membrane protein
VLLTGPREMMRLFVYRPNGWSFSPIFWQSALAFIYRGAGAVVTLLFGVTFARLMNIEEYGVLMSLMSLSLIAATIGLVGQQIQLLREVPSLSTRKDYQAINLLASRRLLVTCLGSLAVTLVVGLAFVIGHGRLAVFGRWEYATSLLLVTPLALVEIQGCLGRALGSVNLALVPKEVLWRLLIILFGTTVFFVSGKRVNAAEVFVIAAIVLLALIVGQQLCLWRLMEGHRVFTGSAMRFMNGLSAALHASVAFWVTSVTTILFGSVDVVIVSIVAGPESGGYYYAANRISLLLDFFMTAFAIGAAPSIARLHDEGQFSEITRLTSSAAFLAFGLVLAGILVLAVVGHQVLTVFGQSFARGQGILMVLAVGQAANAYLGVGSMALNMSGHQKAAMSIMILSSASGLLAMVVATWVFGPWGAAATNAFAVAGMKSWMAAYIYSVDGIDLTATSVIRAALFRWVLTSRLKGAGSSIVSPRIGPPTK